jgi:hypothetical protein
MGTRSSSTTFLPGTKPMEMRRLILDESSQVRWVICPFSPSFSSVRDTDRAGSGSRGESQGGMGSPSGHTVG